MPAPIQVGILTKGRPMLATVIANMVLQDEYPIEIFIVDTGDQPAIKRVDVMSVLRLAPPEAPERNAAVVRLEALGY